MISEKISQQVKNLIQQEFKTGDVILSYQDSGTPGVMTPIFIHSKEDIGKILINSLCVNNLAVYLSSFFQSEYKDIKQKGRIIITAKPCDAKSVVQMISDEQIPNEKILLIVFECDGVTTSRLIKEKVNQEFSKIDIKDGKYIVTLQDKQSQSIQAEEVRVSKCKDGSLCDLPTYYDYYFVGTEKSSKIDQHSKVMTETPLLQERLSRTEFKKIVDTELEKCIRCYACRNICPACFCSEKCIIDKPKLAVPFLDKEVNLANNILFHMIRFNHVAPNCTECGECERVCPQEIKLSIFYHYFNRLVKKEFGFVSGKSDLERQKLLNYRLGEELV